MKSSKRRSFVILIGISILLLGVLIGVLVSNYLSAPQYVKINGKVETSLYLPLEVRFAEAGVTNCPYANPISPQCGVFAANVTVTSKSLVTHTNSTKITSPDETEGTPGTYYTYYGKYSVSVRNNQWYVLEIVANGPNNSSLDASVETLYLDSVSTNINSYSIYCTSTTLMQYNYTTFPCIVNPST